MDDCLLKHALPCTIGWSGILLAVFSENTAQYKMSVVASILQAVGLWGCAMNWPAAESS